MKTSYITSSWKIMTVLAIAGSSLLYSCAKEQEGISNPFTKASDEDSRNIREHLINAYGYAPEAILEYPEIFVVEKDIVFEKKNFWKHHAIHATVDSQGNKHYKGTYKVNPVGTAYVYIQSTVPSAWASAVRGAMTEWNNFQGKIKFTETTNSGSTAGIGLITIKWVNFGNGNATARAPLPGSNGKPGSYVEINSYPGVTSQSKLRTIAHELGHTINFHHTDGTSGTLITTVFASCNTNTNPTSVMNGTSQIWGGFTDCDGAAFVAMYP